jgi:hypothetical protein
MDDSSVQSSTESTASSAASASSASSSCKLFCVDDNQKKQFIADVHVRCPTVVDGVLRGPLFQHDDKSIELVVSGYSKEPGILSGQSVKEGFELVADTSNDGVKLKDFGDYLTNRKKAGIVKVSNGKSFYILPLGAGKVVKQGCNNLVIAILTETQQSNGAVSDKPKATMAGSVPNSSAGVPTPVSTASPSSSTMPKSSGPGGLLSTLLSKVRCPAISCKPELTYTLYFVY